MTFTLVAELLELQHFGFFPDFLVCCKSGDSGTSDAVAVFLVTVSRALVLCNDIINFEIRQQSTWICLKSSDVQASAGLAPQ